jgi:PIN domain nuclease of toxin-antitoxin system
MLNLDTHILIGAVSGMLTRAERQLLAAGEWGISCIELWEIEMLYGRGRIAFGLDHAPLTASLRHIKIWPVTTAICLKLRDLDFHSGPADEIIAATSLAHDVPLVTRDAKIRQSKLLRFGG